MSERNIRLLIEYRGTGFAGWQIQSGQETVQGDITEAIRKVTGQEVELIGAGRTDSGVHALGQVANFRIDHNLETTRFKDALNFYLRQDIRIKESTEAPPEFHARFSAKFRRYRYLMARDESAIYRDLRWETQTELDFEKLRAAAELIVGEHDFGSFCVVASQKPDNRCTVTHSKWRRMGPLLIYEIQGNRFLHSMVRSLVGAMVNLASVKQDNNMRNLTLGRFGSIITGQIEERVVFTAPACGLYLVRVGY
jgi:tRNA pseudouridine38-40 synthase